SQFRRTTKSARPSTCWRRWLGRCRCCSSSRSTGSSRYARQLARNGGTASFDNAEADSRKLYDAMAASGQIDESFALFRSTRPQIWVELGAALRYRRLDDRALDHEW